jgi:hypothetical protein
LGLISHHIQVLFSNLYLVDYLHILPRSRRHFASPCKSSYPYLHSHCRYVAFFEAEFGLHVRSWESCIVYKNVLVCKFIATWTGRIILIKRLAGAVVMIYISGIYRRRISCWLKTCGAVKIIFHISSVGRLKWIYLEKFVLFVTSLKPRNLCVEI